MSAGISRRRGTSIITFNGITTATSYEPVLFILYSTVSTNYSQIFVVNPVEMCTFPEASTVYSSILVLDIDVIVNQLCKYNDHQEKYVHINNYCNLHCI